jgi:hypothetical protein
VDVHLGEWKRSGDSRNGPGSVKAHYRLCLMPEVSGEEGGRLPQRRLLLENQ